MGPVQVEHHISVMPSQLKLLLLSSELQSSRAAERPAGGAAVCRAASGTGADAPAGVQRGGSQIAAPHPQTGEEETPTLQEKTSSSRPSALT